MVRTLLFLALVSCSAAVADNRADDTPVAGPHDHALTDVRGTVTSIRAVHDQVHALDAETLADVRAASAVLGVNCPYNRVSFQLPVALHAVAATVDPAVFDELVRDDWRRLQEGLALHVAAVDHLGGGTMGMPTKRDYLKKVDRALLVARPTDADGLAKTMDLMREIPDLVDAYDDATKAKIDAASATLQAATADQWTLKLQLIGWRDAIDRVRPFTEDPEARSALQDMSAAVSYYLGQFC